MRGGGGGGGRRGGGGGEVVFHFKMEEGSWGDDSG